MSDREPRESVDFIRAIVAEDVARGWNGGRVHTRFPPEPNGYLHIGHAKAICLNFSLAAEYPGGLCNLRFDDTNPTKEEQEYVDSIQEDVRWLGGDWGDRLYFASDYFGKLYEFAVKLVKDGNAYVDSSTAEEIRAMRGTLTSPGKDSPYRERPVEENLDLLERMKNGEFEDGTHVLRARIDMAHPNMNMRDPTLYRIRHATHHRTGDDWCIYPMYDFAHGQSDAIEGITHSLCTLEFEHHRPLYDWFLEKLELVPGPKQIEFARLELSHTILSKRKLLRLVEEGHVDGWDDPRMPTLCGFRRRGYTPEAIRDLCNRVGLAKVRAITELSLLEHCLREHLNKVAERRMAVLHPLKLVIDDWEEGRVDELEAVNNPEDPAAGTRTVPFGKELWIEQDDFREEAPKKYHRLVPGREVRLRYAYLVTCTDVVKDADGNVVEVHCTHDKESRGGSAPDGRKVKGTIHWVSAEHALSAEVRLYSNLFTDPDPGNPPEGKDWIEFLNPDSLEVLADCKLEPSLEGASPEQRFQFERLGYFCADGGHEHAVFNRAATLRDSWKKIAGKKG